MRASLLIGTLMLVAACAEQPAYQQPAPTGAASSYSAAPTQPNPCNRSDFPAGPAGDAEYTNCIIQS